MVRAAQVALEEGRNKGITELGGRDGSQNEPEHELMNEPK